MTRLLVVFDVDSTLIEDEVIELLADAAGTRAEVAAVTDAAMEGKLDFAQSLAARVATLAGLDESVIADALGRIRVTQGAEQLIAAIHAGGGKVGAVSGGFNQLLEPLRERLGLDFTRANQLEIIDSKLTGKTVGPVIDRPAKAQALAEWAAECGLEPQACVAVGDGANDLGMMQVAGLAVGFNAKPIVRDQADIVIGRQDLSELIPLLGL